MTTSQNSTDGSKMPEGLYAPPAATKARMGPFVGWAPLIALAMGMLLSIAWGLYVELSLRGTLGMRSLHGIVFNLVLWGGAIVLLIRRVSRARVPVRGLTLLAIIGSVYSTWLGGSGVFYLFSTLRALAFVT